MSLEYMEFDDDDYTSQREKKLKSKKYQPLKFYHASKKLFKPGDLIIPGYPANYQSSYEGFIYFTSRPEPHYTVLEKALLENWYIYEVEPLGEVWINTLWDDYISDKPAKVIARVGSARGISKPNKLKNKKTEWKNFPETWQAEKAFEAIQNNKIDEFIEIYGKDPYYYINKLQVLKQYQNPKTSKEYSRSYYYEAKRNQPKRYIPNKKRK